MTQPSIRSVRGFRPGMLMTSILWAGMLACGDPLEDVEGSDDPDVVTQDLTARSAARLEAPAQAAAPEGSPSADGPITAPLETWTWIDFPDALCANGTPTGIGVNLTNRSDRVLIFFEGGGGCWDYATCYELGYAANLNGYGKTEFDNRKPYNNLALLQRDSALNPLADASMVYVPYCTGDVHDGDKISDLSNGTDTRTTYFVGYRNVAAYLKRLVPTFPQASRIWVSGWSAGGFGAAFNWDQAQNAFGSIRIDLIDDSGPPIEPQAARWDTWLEAWNMQFPADCADCATGPQAVIEYLGEKYDGTHRLALLSYNQDSTISSYFNISRKRFHAELAYMAATEFDTRQTVKYFFVEGSSHTLLGSNVAAADGTRLYDWLNLMVNEETLWTSIHP